MLRIGRWVACIGTVLLALQEVRAEQDFLPFSVWYGGGKARAPMLEPVDSTSRDRWRKDLAAIRGLGFNTVRTWVEWGHGEPSPGRYDLENLKLLMALAGEAGLRVMVQVYVDSAPDWVALHYPDARFVAQSGDVVTSQSAPGYCFDHPEVRRHILDFYRETSRIATGYPTFLGWDLWSEPHVINWAIIDYIPNASFCYCRHTQNRFRQWLQGRYGALENLNQAWYRTFQNWIEVEPPRFGTILSYTDFIDWRLFVQQKLAEDLGLRAEAVREADAGKVVTAHAAVPCLYTSPLWGVGAPDDWLMAEQVDYWGTSIYPKHSFPERHWTPLRRAVLMDFARSAGKANSGFYVGELQAGTGIRGTIVGDPVTPEDHQDWVWSLISRGARAINVYAYYPMNSGYEAGGYGLIQLDGSITERGRRMGVLARVVTENRSLLLRGRPRRAEIALIYNRLGHLVGGLQNSGDPAALTESLVGIFQAYWKRQIPTDFVHLSEVEEGQLSRYRLAFLPYPLMLTRGSAEQLRAFVQKGGTLVSEARCGWNDERGYAQEIIPGFGLQSLFLAREGRLQMGDRFRIQLQSSGDGFPSREGLLFGKGIRTDLLPDPNTEVLGTFEDGGVAVTRAEYERGQAILIGSFVGWATRDDRNMGNEEFLTGLATHLGILPALEIPGLPEDGSVEVRVTESDSHLLVFLFNRGQELFRLRLPFRTARDLMADQMVSTDSVTLEPGQTRVFVVGTPQR